eukprot:g11854.t1
MSSPRTFGSSLNRPLLVLAFLSSAFFAMISHITPVSAFLTPASSSLSSSSQANGHADRVPPLFGIKRKVKAELESNFSGKVVEPPTAETSMFGTDANALFDVIEKNKKRAAEAAATAAAAADGHGDEEVEGAEGGNASDSETETSNEAA